MSLFKTTAAVATAAAALGLLVVVPAFAQSTLQSLRHLQDKAKPVVSSMAMTHATKVASMSSTTALVNKVATAAPASRGPNILQ